MTVEDVVTVEDVKRALFPPFDSSLFSIVANGADEDVVEVARGILVRESATPSPTELARPRRSLGLDVGKHAQLLLIMRQYHDRVRTTTPSNDATEPIGCIPYPDGVFERELAHRFGEDVLSQDVARALFYTHVNPQFRWDSMDDDLFDEILDFVDEHVRRLGFEV